MQVRYIYSWIIHTRLSELQCQAMLYATDGIDSEKDFEKAMVGVASVWYDRPRIPKRFLKFVRK